MCNCRLTILMCIQSLLHFEVLTSIREPPLCYPFISMPPSPFPFTSLFENHPVSIWIHPYACVLLFVDGGSGDSGFSSSPCGGSGGLRRACSLSDLTNPTTPRRLLPTPPTGMLAPALLYPFFFFFKINLFVMFNFVFIFLVHIFCFQFG